MPLVITRTMTRTRNFVLNGGNIFTVIIAGIKRELNHSGGVEVVPGSVIIDVLLGGIDQRIK
jgi:hypothetical protein